MKNADAAAIRKALGCIKTCAAMGKVTHRSDCPAAGRWLDEAPRTVQAVKREASVPVHELETLITKWGGGNPPGEPWEIYGRCMADVQALIDKVTP